MGTTVEALRLVVVATTLATGVARLDIQIWYWSMPDALSVTVVQLTCALLAPNWVAPSMVGVGGAIKSR